MTQEEGNSGNNSSREEESDTATQSSSKADYDNYYSSLGIALQDYKMRNFSECIPLFRELLMNPVVKAGRAKAVNILNHLAHSLYGTGEKESARERFLEVTALDPVNEMANYGIYCLYEEQQDLQKALAHLKLVADNHASEAYFKELVEFYNKHGKREEARIYLALKVQELQATNPDKHAALITSLESLQAGFGDLETEVARKIGEEPEAKEESTTPIPLTPQPEYPELAKSEKDQEEDDTKIPIVVEEPSVVAQEQELMSPVLITIEEPVEEEQKETPVTWEPPIKRDLTSWGRDEETTPQESVAQQTQDSGSYSSPDKTDEEPIVAAREPEPDPQLQEETELSEAETEEQERREAQAEVAYQTVLVEREIKSRDPGKEEETGLSPRQRDILKHKLDELDAERELLRRREQQLEDQIRLNALKTQEQEDIRKSMERRRLDLLNFEKKTLERVKQAQEFLQQEREQLKREQEDAASQAQEKTPEEEQPEAKETKETVEQGKTQVQEKETRKTVPEPEKSSFQSEEAEEHFHKGNEFFRQHLFEQAVTSYRQALTIEPDVAEVWNNMGVAFDEMGLPTKAIQCYNEANGLDENYRDAYLNKGYNLLKSQLFESAQKAFGKVLELDPDSEEAGEYLEFCKDQLRSW